VADGQRHRDRGRVAGDPSEVKRVGAELLRELDLARVVAGAREPRGDQRAEAQRGVGQAASGAVEQANEGLIGAGEIEAD
jgi:hypothetical protein